MTRRGLFQRIFGTVVLSSLPIMEEAPTIVEEIPITPQEFSLTMEEVLAYYVNPAVEAVGKSIENQLLDAYSSLPK